MLLWGEKDNFFPPDFLLDFLKGIGWETLKFAKFIACNFVRLFATPCNSLCNFSAFLQAIACPRVSTFTHCKNEAAGLVFFIIFLGKMDVA